MITVDSVHNEIQWCSHLAGEAFRALSNNSVLACLSLRSCDPLVIVGDGLVRVMCEKCFLEAFRAFAK